MALDVTVAVFVADAVAVAVAVAVCVSVAVAVAVYVWVETEVESSPEGGSPATLAGAWEAEDDCDGRWVSEAGAVILADAPESLGPGAGDIKDSRPQIRLEDRQPEY